MVEELGDQRFGDLGMQSGSVDLFKCLRYACDLDAVEWPLFLYLFEKVLGVVANQIFDSI